MQPFRQLIASFTLSDPVYLEMLSKAKEVHHNGRVAISMSEAHMDMENPQQILKPKKT